MQWMGKGLCNMQDYVTCTPAIHSSRVLSSKEGWHHGTLSWPQILLLPMFEKTKMVDSDKWKALLWSVQQSRLLIDTREV